jgi:hypothetical protein
MPVEASQTSLVEGLISLAPRPHSGTEVDRRVRMPSQRLVACTVRATVLLCAAALCPNMARAQGRDVPLAERASGAEQVVVGRVSSVTPGWRDNDFGDRLIVSVVRVTVEETLKGASQPSVDVEVEGGTIGNLTLRVSDLETFAPGDRAVFYLTRNSHRAFVPHLRGLGLQKIDRTGRVTGGFSLDQVRRDVRAGAAR